MQYDDRLATVLRPRVDGEVSVRIQYHQLLDLLGTSPADARGSLLDQAYQRLTELSARIAATDRAAMLGEPALRLRSPRLVAALAQGDPRVANAAVRAARLTEEQWLDLIPALPFAARAAMRGRRDIGAQPHATLARLGVGELALPPTASVAAVSPASATTPAAAHAEPVEAPDPIGSPPQREGIGAIVRRIEAFRRAQGEAGSVLPGDSPQLPLGEQASRSAPGVRSFDFSTDPTGRIAWSDAPVAPMVVGIDLNEFAGLAALLRQHQPIRAGLLTLGGAPVIAGAWQIDAGPRFDPQSGRFIGHLGRFRRRAPDAVPSAPLPSRESDRLRQILHELRTPVNAIQGFAEIIQQQLFGATPHEYRALAAGIAADSARILAGFDELERYARLGDDSMELASGESDLAICVTATVERLQPHTGPRDTHFALHREAAALPLALAPLETERLCWRLLATLAGSAHPGETLRLELSRSGVQARLAMQLPEVLAGLDDQMLLHAGADGAARTLSAGMFGTGFALRLAASEAAAAGGRLERREENLNLSLPLLTPAATAHSFERPGDFRQATPV